MKITTACIAAIMAATGLAMIASSALAQERENPRPGARQGEARSERPERPPEGVRPDRPRQDRFARTAEFLNLTEEQKEKIKPIMDSQREQLTALRQEQNLTQEQRREKMMAIRTQTNEKIVALLTPEQKAKWDEMQARRGERPTGRPRGEGRTDTARPNQD